MAPEVPVAQAGLVAQGALAGPGAQAGVRADLAGRVVGLAVVLAAGQVVLGAAVAARAAVGAVQGRVEEVHLGGAAVAAQVLALARDLAVVPPAVVDLAHLQGLAPGVAVGQAQALR